MKAGGGEGAQAANALEELCLAYWYPLYAYVRRRGHGRQDAEDLTQEFFSRLLARRDIAGLAEGNGRFRAFLLASMKHHLANEHDRMNRLKRGGGAEHLSLDWETADGLFQIADGKKSPDQEFDREWALALLERVILRLGEDWRSQGRGDRFDVLKAFLTTPKGEIPYASAAAASGMDENAVRVAVHRLRKNYRTILRAEVANTLADTAMVEEELAVLMGAFSANPM